MFTIVPKTCAAPDFICLRHKQLIIKLRKRSTPVIYNVRQSQHVLFGGIRFIITYNVIQCFKTADKNSYDVTH